MASLWTALNRDDLEELLHAAKVIWIARVEGESSGERCRGDEEVNGSRAASFASVGDDCGEDAAVGTCGIAIERKRIEGRFDPL